MSVPSNRGASRVLTKLRQSIEAGNYYEAHQMYKTLYFRYIGQKKYDECLELLFEGANTFVDLDQCSSSADLCTLIIDTLVKSSKQNEETHLNRLCEIFELIGPNVVEREGLLIKAINATSDPVKHKLGHPYLHFQIGQIMWREGSHEQARHHFLLSREGKAIGNILVKMQAMGYHSEIDLFICQAVLQLLCLKETQTAKIAFETYTSVHPDIRQDKPPFNRPLLNFLYYLLQIISTGKQSTSFDRLCTLYSNARNRDPSYEKYIQKIGAIFFGIAIPQSHEGGGLLGDLFSNLLQRLDDDDTTDEQGDTNTSSTGCECSELD